MTAQIPAPAPQRVPTVREAGCRYCDRYGRACGRHEDLTYWPAPTVEPYRLANFEGKHIRYATRVTIAGVVVDFDGKLPKGAAIRQAEEHIAREAGHQAAWSGRGNFPLADPKVAAIVAGAKVGEKTHVLEAFARSWDRANLAKPVPAVDVEHLDDTPAMLF